MRIIINNAIYDITTFINEHPGGPEVFRTHAKRSATGGGASGLFFFDTINDDNKSKSNEESLPDLTEKFNEVGHSEYAVNILGNYKVEELSEDDPRFNRNHKLEYNKTKISKLVTHEDKLHIHKSMGVISLLNYFYLLFDCFYSGAEAEITLRSVDGSFIGLTWVHTILSLSALQFLIPRTRTGILPMIWQEFRAHSIVFAVRSFLIINALYFFFNSKEESTSTAAIAVRLAFVLFAMKMADFSTEHLRENRKETTTASMPYWSDCPASIQSMIKYFYTHSQFMATIVCLFAEIPYILAVAFPIQIASFLMTLVRKNIISAFWYHMFYGGSLLIVYLINLADVKLYPIVLLGIALIYARVNLKLNKYVLWTLVALVGGFAKYATSDNVSTNDIINCLVWFSVPFLSFFYYYITNDEETKNGLREQVVNFVFEKHRIREESNHRVHRNMTFGRQNGQLHNKITIQLCEKYPKYKPGMYFNLYFDTKKRPYTPVEYTMNTDEGTLKGDTATFLIKRVQTGEVSPLICDKYLVNQTVFVKGPFGVRYYDPSPDVRSFVCDTSLIHAKHVVMCSCGSGITPFYSMGLAWINDRTSHTRQEIHYLSSYRTREDAILRVPISDRINEQLYISEENMKLTPAVLIEYLTNIIEDPDQTNTPEDITVFICGTPAYSQMIKDACAITSAGIKYYEW
jgi:ferredoxin-NADP reductase